MKAITLWQPWASLVAIGAKRIETRSWSTNYRGPIAIHAAKSIPPVAQELWDNEPYFRLTLGTVGIHELRQLPKGAILAVARLVRVEQINVGDLLPEQPERTFGDYSPLRYMWHLEDIQAFAEPVACRGGQQIWNVPIEIDDLMVWPGQSESLDLTTVGGTCAAQPSLFGGSQ